MPNALKSFDISCKAADPARTVGFSNRPVGIETWQWGDYACDVHVTCGKPMDICSLKFSSLDDISDAVKSKRDSAAQWLLPENLETLSACPICDNENAKPFNEVYTMRYRQCSACGHVYLSPRLTESKLREYFERDTGYRRTYTNPAQVKKRIEQIVVPKLQWILERFEQRFGRRPRSILDVGAGAGHFVYACREAGLNAQGIEISPEGVAFAKEHFEIDLIESGFEDWAKQHSDFGCDLVTFWGVIECVNQPAALIDTASKIAAPHESMIVTEVPRAEGFSSAVQQQFPDSVLRHMDPIGHLHLFSDQSLCRLMLEYGFQPAAAWYFGMDIYEWMTQTALRLHDQNLFAVMKNALPDLQQQLDQARLSDEIVLAVIPEKAKETT